MQFTQYFQSADNYSFTKVLVEQENYRIHYSSRKIIKLIIKITVKKITPSYLC